MKKTCGIIIVNEQNQMLVGHSTGNTFFDIPKGQMDEGENPIDTAIRECQEETSLLFTKEQLLELGEFPYNKEKSIHLFLTFVEKNSIDISTLVCESYFEHFATKKLIPEIDSFTWVEITDLEIKNRYAKSMSKVLNKLLVDGFLSEKN